MNWSLLEFWLSYHLWLLWVMTLTGDTYVYSSDCYACQEWLYYLFAANPTLNQWSLTNFDEGQQVVGLCNTKFICVLNNIQLVLICLIQNETKFVIFVYCKGSRNSSLLMKTCLFFWAQFLNPREKLLSISTIVV